MINTLEGPLINTARVIVPGTGTYVELRQGVGQYRLTYIVEFGDKYGHNGSWGRDSYADAMACFMECYAWHLTHDGSK